MVYRLTASINMNKEIALNFTNKLNKLAEIRDSIIKDLRENLMKMGEQDCFFAAGKPSVPIYYIGEDNAEGIVHIDKIKADSDGIIKFHDVDSDEWHWLSYLDDDAIYTLIVYIDWK